MKTKLRIGEVASRAQVSAPTIRYYEREGLLPEPERNRGQRVYTEKIFEILEAIKISKDLGFTLDEILILLGEFRAGEEPSQECRSLAKKKGEELDQLIEDAKRMKDILDHGVSCNCTSLKGCYISDPANETG